MLSRCLHSRTTPERYSSITGLVADMAISFSWNKPQGRIIEEATGGDKTLLFAANESRRLMAPYVPERQHVMIKNVRTYVENDVGVVHYIVPYARFQWGGKVMVSKLTGSTFALQGESKVMTNRNLKYNKALATSHWDKAMKIARGADLARAVSNYIKKGG